ncbi:helix-turn-helix domain-containing protein [Terriglobus sp.]|uniref:helix-turn-helix domain-containing protein n=1 Tax=Terriglobus sp. TaxID=1889013 RepID=UPI003B00D44B
MKIDSTAAILVQFEARQADMKAGRAGMFTTMELCRLLSVTKQTVSTWVSQGTIPHFRIGTLLRFDPVQLIAWIEQRQSA